MGILYSNIRGQGEAVILLHGLFGSSDNLGRVAVELANDHQVHALDLRNHGKSEHFDKMNYTLMAEDVISYMDEKAIKRVSILGHSMGGKVAMMIALLFPARVKKLIIADIAPVIYQPHHQEIFKGLLSVDFSEVKTRNDVDKVLAKSIEDIGVRQFLLKNLQTKAPESLAWRMNVNAIYRNYKYILQGMEAAFSPFDKPVLFLAGGLSDYIKLEYKEQTVKLFPNAEMKVIEGATHWLHAEKPRMFINICSKFLLKNAG